MRRSALAAALVLFAAPICRAETCAYTASDRAANARLDFALFDQANTAPSAWRALVMRGCRAEAVAAIEDYMLQGPAAGPHARAVLAFHLAQLLAETGDVAGARVAILSARDDTPQDDGFDWTDYVRGTAAFLARDRGTLEAALAAVRARADHRDQVNAVALGGLLACFSRPYAEASSAACRKPFGG